MDINEHSDGDVDGEVDADGEGVWSPDIEQCFREALLLFPPCGRRKHILQEEGGGKMYGRNELIARHIKMRTGKTRTRKQVSSHIQVLARRKAKAEGPSNSLGISPSPPSFVAGNGQAQTPEILAHNDQSQLSRCYDTWTDRAIVTQKIRLVEFSAFIEHRGELASSLNRPATFQTEPQSIPFNSNQRDLRLQPSNHHQQQQEDGRSIYFGPPTTQKPNSYPLTSNHHLTAQFNQAPYNAVNSNDTTTTTTTTSTTTHHHHSPATLNIMSNNQQQHQQVQPNSYAQSASGFVRHSYVKIDYSEPHMRQPTANRFIESISINQIVDKFPEIGGSEGLFQRGPADAFFLVKFWADINNDFEFDIDDQNSFFGFSSRFETSEPYRDITCSTKACSYGLQVVEKVEKIYGALNNSNGRYSFNIARSPMCEFMVQFIRKLRQLPRISQMNSVLENFTVLQVVTSESTSETLLCLAYVFEVASKVDKVNGPQCHVYKLTRD